MIPTVIIGGYLGAGKTTLINRFLSQPQGRRITVLVNDFGAINIDAALIKNTTGDTIALTNGCACCSIGDSLLEAAQAVTHAAPPDLLLVEASGIAHPARMAATLMGAKALAPATCLTVVNGTRWQQNLRDKYIGTLFASQIKTAHSLSLNRFSASGQQSFQNALAPLPPLATTPDIAATDHPARPQATPLSLSNSNFHTQTLTLPNPIQLGTLNHWLNTLPSHVERIKGTVLVQAENGKTTSHRLNYTQKQWALSLAPYADGTLVIIARGGPNKAQKAVYSPASIL